MRQFRNWDNQKKGWGEGGGSRGHFSHTISSTFYQVKPNRPQTPRGPHVWKNVHGKHNAGGRGGALKHVQPTRTWTVNLSHTGRSRHGRRLTRRREKTTQAVTTTVPDSTVGISLEEAG